MIETYLYLKKHKETGLLYFGKTTKDPLKYNGSGKYWLRHLRKHGFNIRTLWIKLYTNEFELTKDAMLFSQKYCIDTSDKFANCRMENGFDGKPAGAPGHIFTKEELELLSLISKKKWEDEEFRMRLSNIHKKRYIDNPNLSVNQSNYLKNVFWTDQRKKEHSERLKGHVGTDKCKGVPKYEGFGAKVSASLKGKPKSEEHKRNLSIAAKKRKKDYFKITSL